MFKYAYNKLPDVRLSWSLNQYQLSWAETSFLSLPLVVCFPVGHEAMMLSWTPTPNKHTVFLLRYHIFQEDLITLFTNFYFFICFKAHFYVVQYGFKLSILLRVTFKPFIYCLYPLKAAISDINSHLAYFIPFDKMNI